MKFLTNKQINQIKNEVITKMYHAIRIYSDRLYQLDHPDSDVIKSHDHDLALDCALGEFYREPRMENKYDWCKTARLEMLLHKGKTK